MSAVLKLKNVFKRIKSVFSLQKLRQSAIEGASEAESCANMDPKVKSLAPSIGEVDTSKWKTIDSRALGIRLSMIPFASKTVVKILQEEGHDAYLVGGCVRDLLLNKTPKDFDVITTANLLQIKKKFHHAYIVGKRFPICKVSVRGSEIEVSSFETAAQNEEGIERVRLSEMPGDYDKKDLLRWEDSLYRDFTVNSMFYDPFAHKIYDYSNGMEDLTAKKLRTLVPACSSFQEDCARILRGLRIAARLGFSFEKDTERALHNLHASVQNLDKGRLMQEMNYLFSYGAAQSSLLLLQKFNLLQILFPFQAAYLAEHSAGQTPVMLMKLFSNLDNVVSCDRPCDIVMWLSLMVFHLALVNNPQDARVIWAFSALLYHGSWEEGVKAAREFSEEHISFAPEIFNSFDDVADEKLARRVSQFASIVLKSIDALTNFKTLRIAMERYPSSPCADTVFISKNAGRVVDEIFHKFVKYVKSVRIVRECYKIDYELLGKGSIEETRFVLGKVMMDTMRDGITTQRRTKLLSEKKDDFHASKLEVEQVKLKRQRSNDFKLEVPNSKGKEKRNVPKVLVKQITKKQKQNKISSSAEETLVKNKLGEILSCQVTAKGDQQLKKESVKKVMEFHSQQKEMTKQDLKVKAGQNYESHTLEELPTMKPHQSLAPNEILHVLEKVSHVGKQYNNRASEGTIHVQRKRPKISKQNKDQAPVEILNVLNRFNIKGREDPSKRPSKSEKQPTTEENSEDESKRTRKAQAGKLPNLFK